MKIYLDNAATTKPVKFKTKIWGNPSSPHSMGIKAERKISEARERLALFLGVKPQEIYYTSGATESNNIAIQGLNVDTIITEPWEHPAILEPVRAQQNKKRIIIDDKKIWMHNMKEYGKCLVCLSHVNHETGDIHDINVLAQTIKEQNPEAIILIDAAQSMCKEVINLTDIDLLSFSGHKFHGPTGIGGLFKREGLHLSPIIFGGGQEKKLRPGTENIHAILHMDAALTAYNAANNRNEGHSETRLKSLHDKLSKLTEDLPDTFLNHRTETKSAFIINLSFLGLKGETLVHMLSERGIYASMGAACNTRKNEKPALEAMGFPPERVSSAVRFSFSYTTYWDHIERAKPIIEDCVKSLRRVFRR